MSFETRFELHGYLSGLIVRDYFERELAIEDDDPHRTGKLSDLKEQCTRKMELLNRYFFGQKQLFACEGCPLMNYFVLRETEKLDEPAKEET